MSRRSQRNRASVKKHGFSTAARPGNGSFSGDRALYDPEPGRRRGWPVGVMVLATLVMVALLVVLLADRLFHPEKFQIKQIEVKGEFVQVGGQQIKEVVESYLVGNYFSASLPRLESHIEALPWVFSASLRRVWPSTLRVDIVEVQPVAEWGNDQWVHFTGDLVSRQYVENTPSLPILDGPESQRVSIWEQFKTWSSLFASHGFSLDLLRLEHGHLWVMDVSLGALAATYRENAGDDITRNLPIIDTSANNAETLQEHALRVVVEQQDADKKIERLIDVLKEELLIGFPRIRAVDLRYPNGFAVEWISGEPEFGIGSSRAGSK